MAGASGFFLSPFLQTWDVAGELSLAVMKSIWTTPTKGEKHKTIEGQPSWGYSVSSQMNTRAISLGTDPVSRWECFLFILGGKLVINFFH